MPNINVKVGYTIDKSGLNEIKKQLQDIRVAADSAKLSGKLTKDLETAGRAASQLEDILNSAWNNKLNQLDLSKVNNGIKDTYKNIQNLKDALSSGGSAGASAYNNFARSILNTNTQLKQTSKLIDRIATTFGNVVRYSLSTSVFNTLSSSVQKAYDYTVKLDTSLNDIRIVTGKSAEEMDKFAVRANRVARDLGKSTRDFTEASLIYYQQGLGNEEAQARAEVTLKAANVTGQTGKEVSEQLTAVWNGYKVTADEAELYVDKLAAVAASTASDLEELSTGMSKVASAANIMGVDVDQLNAQLATIVSVTRQAPESVGTALKTIYARMGDIQSGLDDETTLGSYTEKMAQYGVNVLDANGKLREMGEVIEEIGGKWDTLSREQQTALSQIMAGSRQYNNLLSLFDNWDTYTKALETSANAAGTLQKQQDTYMESTAAHLKQLSTEAERTYDILFDQDTVNGFANSLTGVLNLFNDLLEGLGGGTRDFVFFGSTVAGILNKQIGGALEKQIENVEAMRANLERENIQRQIINAHAARGEDVTSAAALEKEIPYAEKTLQLQRYLTEEQSKQFTEETAQIGVLEQRIRGITQYKDIAEKLGITIHKDAFETQEEFEKQLQQQQALYQEEYKKYNLLRENLVNYNNTTLKTKEQKRLTSELKKEIKEIKITKEEENRVSEVTQKIKDGEKLTEDEIWFILNLQKRTRDEIRNNVKQLEIGVQGVRDAEEGLLVDLTNEQELREQNLKTMQAQVERQKTISMAVQGLSGAVSTISAISGIFSTITDKDIKPWEKFQRVLSTIVVTIPAAVMAFKGLSSILPALTIGMNTLAVSIGAIGTGATVSFGEATAAVLGFKTDLGPLGWVLLGITALVAGIGLAVSNYQKEQNAANAELEKATERAEAAKKSFQDLSDSYNNLKSSIKKYTNTRKAIDELNEGTQEWKEQVLLLNQAVLDLLDKYPKLLNYVNQSKNGLMTIDEKGFDSILKEQQDKLEKAQVYSAQTKIAEVQARGGVATDNLRKQINTLSRFSDEGIRNIAKTIAENQETVLHGANEDLKGILSDYLTLFEDWEINDAIKQLKENNNELVEFNSKMNSYDNNIGTYTNTIISTLGRDNKNYQNSQNKNAINRQAGNYYNENYEKIKEQLQNSSVQDIASLYLGTFGEGNDSTYSSIASRYGIFSKKGFYMGGTESEAKKAGFITREEAIEKIATQYASSNLENQLENISTKVDKFIKDLDEFSVGGKYGGGNSNLGQLFSAIASGQNIANIYDKEQLKSFGETFKAHRDLGNFDNKEQAFEEMFGLTIDDISQNIATAIENGKDAATIAEIRRNQFIATSGKLNDRAVNLQEGIQSGSITAGNIAENEDYQIILKSLDELKQVYPEVTAAANVLEETWLVGSQEYIEALEIVQDKLYQVKIGSLEEKANELRDSLLKALNEVGDNPVEIKALLDDEEFKKQMDDYLNAEYQIDVAIHAEAEDEFNSIVSAMNEISEQASKIGENFIVSANDIRELNNVFPGIIENMQSLGDGTVQLNEDIVNSAIGAAQAEVAADSEATIKKLRNQQSLLAKKEEIYRNMANAATTLAQSETESDQTSADARAEISKGLTDLKGINDKLQTQQEMDNDKAAADASYTNGEITAKNWSMAYQSAANSSYQFATVAVANNKAAAGLGSPVAPGNFGVNYGGSTGTSSEAKVLEGTQNALNNAGTSKGQWEQLAQKYNMLAESARKSANDIDGMIAQIGASNVEIANSLGNIRNGLGASPSSGKKSKGGSGGGGSAKEPAYMDTLKDEKDIYHDIDIVLSQISTELDKLDKQKKKLFGKDLINNLNKQLSLLNKQIDASGEKISIARGEADLLRTQLLAAGVSFNSDGTISNYTDAYNSQLNYVNSLIAQYDSMSAEAQEGFKDTVDAAKESFEQFVKNIDRYDEVVTNLIPDLEADIQEAVDEKIDLQIEKFDMEIEIRLNLAEAERNWNDFKKKIIDNIEDDDMLGNAMAKLVDFSSYYKEDETGIVQALRKQVDNTLAELNAMDTNGWSNVYGDNRTSALEDLQKYYKELMSNLTDVLELQKEIHQSYIDMMDEAQEKFDEQIESYEMISDLIDHDMKVISLVYGDESYSQLSNYYNKQQQNFNSQLDFQRQQVEFWRQQLDALDEGSDAWDNAKEKWANAVEELNSTIESSIENLQSKYLNTINLIFQDLNNKVTDNLGLDYIEEEWNLINKNADQYLDTINSLYETQKLENKYLDAIDQTDSISAQRQIKKIMDEELAGLRERDKLTQYDIERANRRYEIALKQVALQEAQQNKSKMRLRRDSQGNYRYEYVSDENQVGQLQDELNDMYNSLYNFDKARYQDNLNQMYSIWAEFQQKMAEAAQINDPVARSERELLLQTQYEQLINGLTEQNATVRGNLHESAFDDLSRLYDVDVSNFQNMSNEEKDVLMSDLIPAWESGVQHMTDVFAGDGGFLGVCKDAFDQLHEATKDYEDGLDELENTGRINFESIGEGIDENINRTQQLISDNTELINTYEQELTAIGNVMAQLDGLIDKYNSAREAAVAATKAAYEYWSAQQREAARAAGNESQGSGSGNGSSSNNSSNSSGSSGGQNSGADGNLVVGETATFSGSYYYDSYGTTPAGSKYSGVTDGIVVDRIVGNPYGIHIHSADGRYPDLGWIKKSQLSGYDTGGYTGTWGNDGRLALLHQKELVLNKEDTANMLNAINIMRNITNMLGSSVLSKLAAATAGGLNTEVGKDVLEQNVHIDAQFPNVRDSKEIEDALNNLVNMASMRANRSNY